MRLFQPTRAVLVSTLALATALSACKSAPKASGENAYGTTSAAAVTDAGRAPASSVDETEMENSFQALLADQSSAILKTNYLERLLRIYYRAELYVEQFEGELDGMLAKQKQDKDFQAEPLQAASYKKLLQMWMLTHREKDKIEFIYSRLLETSKDTSLKDDRPGRATAILGDTEQWLEQLPEEDKLQMFEVIQSLAEIKLGEKHASNDGAKSSRQPASVLSTFAFMSEHELAEKIRKHKKKTRRKAMESAAWKDAEVDADPGNLVDFTREPNTAAGAVIRPSAGADGNFYGRQSKLGTFVLTFDDGPGPKSTQRLHGILKSHQDSVNGKGAPATFFCLVNATLKNPTVIGATKAAGYHMNNHSWTHANFAKSSPAQLQHEVVDSTPALQKAFGYKFRFYRCPYGACFAPAIPVVRQMIADQGLIHAYWRIDSADWKNIGQPQRTADIVIKQMQLTKNGVILMHDIHESSVDAAKIILDWITANNAKNAFKIRLVDLEKAVDEVNGVASN